MILRKIEGRIDEAVTCWTHVFSNFVTFSLKYWRRVLGKETKLQYFWYEILVLKMKIENMMIPDPKLFLSSIQWK